MVKYRVWCICEEECLNYEPPRIIKTLEDPHAAIVLHGNVRDLMHQSYIDLVRED